MIEYRCKDCGAVGVKLWRGVATCALAIDLRCVDCALAHCNLVGKVAVDNTGRCVGEHGVSDQLYSSETGRNLLPAIPADGGTTFWGYTSVPEREVKWWQALPLRIAPSAIARDYRVGGPKPSPEKETG